MDDDGLFLAGAIAYQIFFALIPLLALIIGIFGFVYGTEQAELELGQIVRSVLPAVTGQEAKLIGQLVHGRALSLGFGLVGTLLTVTAILGSIDIAISHILGREGKRAFVRERLLPQDRIALMAWNRATDFTTNHDLIARTVARYGEGAEAIETDLKAWFSGLRALYGSTTIPPHIQRRIDAVFAEAGSLRPRELAPGQIADAPRREVGIVADRMAADGQVAVLGLRTHRDGLAETTYGGVRYTARAVQS